MSTNIDQYLLNDADKLNQLFVESINSNTVHDEDVSILTEDMNDDIEILKNYGYTVKDKDSVGEFNIVLFELVGYGLQLGMSHGGNSMLQQQDVDKGTSSKNYVRDFRSIVPVIESWISKYGDIHVGSENPRKSKTYKRMFDRYTNIKTSEIYEIGGQLVFNIS